MSCRPRDDHRLLTTATLLAPPAIGNLSIERRERLGGNLNFYFRRACVAAALKVQSCAARSKAHAESAPPELGLRHRGVRPADRSHRRLPRQAQRYSGIAPRSARSTSVAGRRRSNPRRSSYRHHPTCGGGCVIICSGRSAVTTNRQVRNPPSVPPDRPICSWIEQSLLFGVCQVVANWPEGF